MIEAAINKILGLARPEILHLAEGLRYTNQKLYPVPDPMPSHLDVETLTGLLDYIQANRDMLSLRDCMIIIEDFKTVRLVGSLQGAFLQRSVYMIAECRRDSLPFGNYMDIEAFIIWLQASFLDAGDRAKILAIVGNIQDGQIANFTDDGVTQSVNVKTGITKVEVAPVPNPVTLTPYRTFIDAVQPASSFVFRLRSGSGSERPKAALFEADGGKWETDCILNVRTYLEVELQALGLEIPVIA